MQTLTAFASCIIQGTYHDFSRPKGRQDAGAPRMAARYVRRCARGGDSDFGAHDLEVDGDARVVHWEMLLRFRRNEKIRVVGLDLAE